MMLNSATAVTLLVVCVAALCLVPPAASEYIARSLERVEHDGDHFAENLPRVGHIPGDQFFKDLTDLPRGYHRHGNHIDEDHSSSKHALEDQSLEDYIIGDHALGDQSLEDHSIGDHALIDQSLEDHSIADHALEGQPHHEADVNGMGVNCRSTKRSHAVHGRMRRSLRPVMIQEINETRTDFVISLGGDYSERYRFRDPPPERLEINPVTGAVRLKSGEVLDYETAPEIVFSVLISRVDLPEYAAEQPVRVRVLDENDELPTFRNVPRPFLAQISANAAPSTSVYQLMAQDRDLGSTLRYWLESGGEDRFVIDPDTGVVRTRGAHPFPPGKEYEIGVSAEDTSAPPAVPPASDWSNREQGHRSASGDWMDRGQGQKSPTQSLKIFVGERAPQFFEAEYVATVAESADKHHEVVVVKALSHQGLALTYELTTDTGAQSNEFAIDPRSGAVDLLRQLDYERDERLFRLKVKAVESRRVPVTSTVSLIVNLIDVNDNTPTFPLSQYIVQGVAETVPVGTDIINVTATDGDSVTNAQLTYTVSDDNFAVETIKNVGHIKSARRLDYDGVSGHTYNFSVVATDNGSPVALRGSANVRVSVTNVNDEAPTFTQPLEYVQVSEDAAIGTVVHVVQAYDLDGDDVTYSFVGDRLTSGPFTIDSSAGILTLARTLDKSVASYRLNISATDNGRCCSTSHNWPAPATRLTNREGRVIVEVKDINNNAPRFPRCTEYHPVAMEGDNVGTFVVQVQAVDSDIGANGNVTYSLVKSTDHGVDRFDIDPTSGRLTTADVFDREAKIGVTDFGVTVKAEDHGSPRLAGFCTFRVKIGDRNDNAPVFNLHEYQASIEESSVPGRRVKQVYTTDRDAGDNSRVEYSLRSDSSNSFFSIHSHSGWVTVARPMFGHKKVQLEIVARDRGEPPRSSSVRMDVEITQTMNEYPRWPEEYSTTPIRLSENVQVNYEVKRLKATSSTPDSLFNYVISNGDLLEQNGHPSSFYSRVDEATNEMVLMTYRPLDYEALPRYTLTIKAANRAVNPLHSDLRVTVELRDENDEIPQFVGLDENGRYPGSVAENLRPGSEVITVTATDRDEFPAFKKISYRIKDAGEDYSKFTIDSETGVIRTKMSFDRELKSEYYITVLAQDGAPSNRSNHHPPGTPNQGEAEVQVRITDKNDNAPYFRERRYAARVPENTDPGTVIMTVTAEDMDEENGLTYSITSGNEGNVFEVVPDLGEIKVRGHLDYESGSREYRLTYRVFDDKFANSTMVIIEIVDVNDNAPEFDSAIYHVLDLMEEEAGVNKKHPKYLLTVHATDPDVERKSALRYGLTGQFADDGTFRVNEHSGEVFLTRPLDRDPPRGRGLWNFNVLAHDEMDPLSTQPSLTGYAEVRVKPMDINDNAPVFDRARLVGRVPEHSRAGVSVLTVTATDADHGLNGSVSYTLRNVSMRQHQPLFSIDAQTGLVSTMQADALDREAQAEYQLVVVARDKGFPPLSATATVTIHVEDINDHAPMFTQRVYAATMSESLPAGASITSVSATDRDVGVNARLLYSLATRDREHFTMTSVEATNTGVLKVHKPVDYDKLLNPLFNLTVYVEDMESTHVDTAYIELRVTDYNDNAPTFVPPHQRVQIPENVTVGTTLYRFSAIDRDTGVNKLFTYSIDVKSDPERQFAINSDGLITTVKALDRETRADHRVHILAIDKGTPALTGVGTLFVVLLDVNDNAPQFAESYRPIVYEGRPAGQRVIEVSAVDRDSVSNGPLFEFSVPCGGKCPCPANPACGHFAFRFVPGGGSNGHGSGVVTSLRQFDREQQKEYHLPIILRDSGAPPTSGTSTLTIVIGDVNDNEHHPGHKDIIVYNYRGSLKDAALGNVYAEDLDDWDVDNKTFSFVSENYNQYFRLDQDSGELYTRGRVPAGVHTLKVKVYDSVYKREVTSSVSVTLKDVGERAVLSSGSMRLQGVTAEEFVAPPGPPQSPGAPGPRQSQAGAPPPRSRYQLLHALLSQMLSVPAQNVDIFTVRNHVRLARTVDVRYSAHGSPFYLSQKLDGLAVLNRDEIESQLGVVMLASPVDNCSPAVEPLCEEGRRGPCAVPPAPCEGAGGCTNTLVVTDEPLVVNSNRTSLVGVTAYTEARCMCAAREFERAQTERGVKGEGMEWAAGEGEGEGDKCGAKSCFNGGVCRITEGAAVRCVCPVGFDGPRCQQTRHSFHGDGAWAWYPAPAPCADSHTSLELVTTATQDALILYHGPVAGPRDGGKAVVEPYLVLELFNGLPMLRVNAGSGELRLMLDGKDKQGQTRQGKLTDGLWHAIDIFKSGRTIQLVVDSCLAALVTESENSPSSVQDRRACEAVGDIPGGEGAGRLLSIPHSLQLGGRAPFGGAGGVVTGRGFNGCIRDLVHNGELYDLHVGRAGAHNHSADGCTREDSASCGSADSPGALTCGVNGTCSGGLRTGAPPHCVCKAGWRGTKCDISTKVMNFKKHSFVEWDFKPEFYKQVIGQLQHTDLTLMFRSRQITGLLLKAQSAQKSEYIMLEIVSSRVRVRYNLGGGVERDVMLSRVNVSDGQWHTITVRRVGQWVTLRADGGEGRFFNESTGTYSRGEGQRGHAEMVVQQRGLLVGGDVRFPADGSPPLVDSDFENGCISDVRFNGQWLPMDQSESGDSRGVEFSPRSQNVESGCASDGCTVLGPALNCAPERVCVDLWRHAECRCPVGQRLVAPGQYRGSLCETVGECALTPGLCHWGACMDTPGGGHQCSCEAGYGGVACSEARRQSATAELGWTAWLAILLCAALLITLLLLLLLHSCRRATRSYDDLHADDDVRENMIHYDEEGIGEQDQTGYDISQLRKRAGSPYSDIKQAPPPAEKLFPFSPEERPRRLPRPRGPADDPTSDLSDFIGDRLWDADHDPTAPPHESVREYAYEGEGSTAGSLSSLDGGSDAGEPGSWDYLNAWGPRFNRLAAMYSGGDNDS